MPTSNDSYANINNLKQFRYTKEYGKQILDPQKVTDLLLFF